MFGKSFSMRLCAGKYLFSLLLIVTYVLITGCSKNDMPFPRCISADYFGPKPVSVSAHFPSDHDAFMPEDGEIIDPDTGDINYGFHHNQVVKWKDTGLETNGDSLVVRVNGAWTSWSNNNKKTFKSNYSLEGLERLKYETKFEGRGGDTALPGFHLICNNYKSVEKDLLSTPSATCSVSCKHINEHDSEKRNAPCWFTNGYGAYLLFKRPGDNSPNENLKSMRNPQSPAVHLGYNSIAEGDRGESGVFTLDRNNPNLKDERCNPLKLEKGWKIYVKILDRYYLDNVGGYSFEFLGGVQRPSSSGFFGVFDYVYNYLKCVLLINKNCERHFDSSEPAAAQAMFKGIAENSTSFHNFVLSLLVLYIVISSLLYLFGMVQDTRHDMLIRMMKITLIVILISPGSFEFFYNHFLILFIAGLEQLIKIITNFAPNSNTDGLFTFMEDMGNKFFSYAVWKKFAALIHYKMWTVFLIPLIFAGIVLYFLLCAYAYVIFLSGFIGLAFLIAIMPLFLIAILDLFSGLKSLFDGWIKFCISFCLQSVMIFTLLSLLGALIMNTFYKQLGFTACYNKWFEIRLCIGSFCIMDTEYFGWTPGQVFVPYTIGSPSEINVDKNMEGIEKLSREGGTVKFTGGAGYIPLPPDYVEKGFRYLDYPFLNPVPGTQGNPADHYIAEDDIVVNESCVQKELVRLTNSLSHAVEKLDILSLINSIDSKIGIKNAIKNRYCQPTQDPKICKDYIDSYEDYKKDIVRLNLKGVIKSLVKQVAKEDLSCQLQKFHEVNKEYQDNHDYQKVQNIKLGYLIIEPLDIVVLFLLSFLMFSLRKLAQEIGSNIARGGYSVYNISKMYEGGGIFSQIQLPKSVSNFLEQHRAAPNLMGLIFFPKHMLQMGLGGGLTVLGNWANHLPNRLTGGAANLLGRIPVVGGVLKHSIDLPRKLVNMAIETTKFATSPKNNIDKLEEKIYGAFGIDKEDILHRKIDRYLNYYKGWVGSHLGYTIEDAMKFTWKHGLDSIGVNPATKEKYGYENSLFYRAKSHRREFLNKLYDETIGRKRVPEKDKDEDDNKSSESVVQRPSGSEESVVRSSPGTGSRGGRYNKRKAPDAPTETVRRDLPGESRIPDQSDEGVDGD